MAPDHGDRKTRPTDDDVDAFIAAVEHQRRRDDTARVVELMRQVTETEPTMWGTMIGFGVSPYSTADGKQRETFTIGLAARRQALTLYGLTFDGSNEDLLERLGPHTVSKACLYIKRLDACDQDVLRELVGRAWAEHHTAG